MSENNSIQSYKGYIFDLDNTLYTYNPRHKRAMAAVESRIKQQCSIDSDTFEKAFKESRKETHQDLDGTACSHHRTIYFKKVCEKLNLSISDYPKQWANLYWDTFFEDFRVEEDALYVLDKLAGPAVLLTDLTVDIQLEKFKRLKLETWFMGMVTSEEVGVEKPNPAMFNRALNVLKMAPEDVVMIGDNYEKDCVGAASLGIRSYWVNKENVIRSSIPDMITEVRSLHDIS